ncbi:ribosome biogenesis GTPase Der [Thermodesulfobacteriota bacterium]
MKPIVAIIGRPNVGKSTFFNRITRTRDALVDNVPGVTRDRIYGDVAWDGVEFALVDTGGFLMEDTDTFAPLIRSQIRQALDDADIIVLILDGKSGLSPFDQDLIDILRQASKPVFYVVNKIDGIEKEAWLYEFFSLGIEKLYPVSSEHGYGVNSFMDDLVRVVENFASRSPEHNSEGRIRISVVGRPNVGKSSLINKILRENRLLVSDIPGTTRDAIDSLCKINGKSYLLIDTAGIRRKARVSKKLEKFSVIKALRSLERCDVALIVMDADQGITEQDVRIAGYAYERGCGCIFLMNKWDLVEKDSNTVKRYVEELQREAKFLRFVPVLTISALSGLRVPKIFNMVDEVYGQYATRIGTGQVNKIFERATQKSEPSLYQGKRLKLYYTTQTSIKPPTFVCFVNYPEGIHFSYKRYLINQIRTEAGLDRTPIRIIFRKRSG